MGDYPPSTGISTTLPLAGASKAQNGDKNWWWLGTLGGIAAASLALALVVASRKASVTPGLEPTSVTASTHKLHRDHKAKAKECTGPVVRLFDNVFASSLRRRLKEKSKFQAAEKRAVPLAKKPNWPPRSQAEFTEIVRERLMQTPSLRAKPMGEGTGNVNKKSARALEELVQLTMKRALWDLIKQDLERGHVDRFLPLIVEIREGISALTPNRKDLHGQLQEVLDVDLIKQQVEHTNSVSEWDVRPMCQFVINRIRDLEAPARNPITDKWLNTWRSDASDALERGSSPIPLLEKFFDFVHSKLSEIPKDMEIAYFRTVGSHAVEHGSSIDREAFERKLALNGGRLPPKLCAWAKATMSECNPEYSLSERYRTGVLALVLPGSRYELETKDPDLEPLQTIAPETMEDAVERLQILSRSSMIAFRMAYTLLRLKQVAPGLPGHALSKIIQILDVDVERVTVTPSADKKTYVISQWKLSTISQVTCAAILKVLDNTEGVEFSESSRDALQRVLNIAFDPSLVKSDAVYGIVIKRLNGLVTGLVVPHSEKDREANLAKLGNDLMRLGLEPKQLQGRIEALVGEITHFCNRDFKTFCSVAYTKVLV